MTGKNFGDELKESLEKIGATKDYIETLDYMKTQVAYRPGMN